MSNEQCAMMGIPKAGQFFGGVPAMGTRTFPSISGVHSGYFSILIGPSLFALMGKVYQNKGAGSREFQLEDSISNFETDLTSVRFSGKRMVFRRRSHNGNTVIHSNLPDSGFR